MNDRSELRELISPHISLHSTNFLPPIFPITLHYVENWEVSLLYSHIPHQLCVN